MDNNPSQAAAHIASINVLAHPLSEDDSCTLPVSVDRTTNRIIDGIYPRQVRFEHRHPPQVYPTTTTPCIVTQPDLSDSQAAALLNMLQVV